MTPSAHDSADDLRTRAAQWFARMNSGAATTEERQSCAAWRAADPAHEQAYRKLEQLWQASAQLPREQMQAMLAASRAATSQPRRRLSWALATLCMTALAALIVIPLLPAANPDFQASYDTEAGIRRDVTLPDGSVLNLNGNTHLRVTFIEGRREVELHSGQAFFTVQHKAGSHFVVNSGNTQVTVTGTRFDVRHDDGRVVVESGSVDVESGAWWHRTSRSLTAGQAVEQAADGTLSAVMPAKAEDLSAWRLGKIIFDNAPLARVVQEMNRYLPQPATLQAPALRDYRVAGVFNIDDPQAILDALPAVAPVQVLRQPDGSASIVPR